MKEQLENLRTQALAQITKVDTLDGLLELKNSLLGKK